MVFLKVCIQACFDDFERMDHAMNPKKPIAIPLGRPLAIPPCIFLVGTGVAYKANNGGRGDRACEKDRARTRRE